MYREESSSIDCRRVLIQLSKNRKKEIQKLWEETLLEFLMSEKDQLDLSEEGWSTIWRDFELMSEESKMKIRPLLPNSSKVSPSSFADAFSL